MFESIKNIHGDIASGTVKDQRIALSQEQLVALDAKLKILTGELSDAKAKIVNIEAENAQLRTENANLRAQMEKPRPTGESQVTGLTKLDEDQLE